jgi:hypothetical protein
VRSTAGLALDKKIAGWEWIRSEFTALRKRTQAETNRLLGPDRGE